MTRQCEETKVQEQIQQQEADDLKEKVLTLKSESKFVKEQHKDATTKFAQANGGLSLGAVDSGLKKLDEDAHARAVDDILPRRESQPIWKGVEFLETADGVVDPLSTNDVKLLKKEVVRMKQENRLFASELEKTETLLKLQKDIETETSKYLLEEKKRLELLAQ